MAAITSIIAGITAAASLATGIKGIVSSGGSKSSAPAPVAAPLPPGPPADLTKDGILGQPSAPNLAAPRWAGISDNMTGLQKRAKIATYGTSGDSRYADSSIRDLYKNLALSDYKAGSYNPIDAEYQYAENVLGQKPRERTAESLISAILRG